MTRFFSEALHKHDRSAFASGNDRIDTYFRQVVGQDIKRQYAACYVLIERDTVRLAGFYTLSSHSIPLSEVTPEVAQRLPRYPSIPAVLIGWLGRDAQFRGQQVGSLLLADAIHRLANAPAGIHAVCADAIDEAAMAFYQKHQFTQFQSRPGSLYLPMKTALARLG